MIKSIIRKGSSITKGYYYLFFKDETVEEFAVKRAEICYECTSLSTKTMLCMKCGCFINAKVRSNIEECPLSKWKAIK